jgi:hypothetical protein
MTPEKFIERNVARVLADEGFTASAIRVAVKDAVRVFRTSPNFSKCLEEARRAAKKMTRPKRVRSGSHG